VFLSCLCGVLLQVFGIDVGHGQVMGSIAQDPRVTVMERTNLRHLKPEQLPEQVRSWACTVGASSAVDAMQTFGTAARGMQSLFPAVHASKGVTMPPRARQKKGFLCWE
jgi:predicted rRNA methylase YqxC with S4 and FtsJ domains